MSCLLYNIKHLLKPVLQAFLFINIMFFVSCSDDKVTPPPPVSADTIDRYDWTQDTLYGIRLYDTFVLDSLNVYFVGYPYPVHYNGKTYAEININPPGFSEVISAYDINNVFIGGGIPGVPFGDPILKKITNGVIESYTIQSDSGVFILDILPDGPNSCWISTVGRWNVYYFDNGIFNRYSLDSGSEEGHFYKNNNGQIFVVTNKVLSANDYEVSVFKFIDNSFMKVLSDTVNPYTDKQYYIFRSGNDLLRAGLNGIYYYVENSWIILVNTPDYSPVDIGGNSKGEFVTYEYAVLSQYKLFTWNGLKWKEERNPLIPKRNLFGISVGVKGDFAVLTSIPPYANYVTFVTKGKLKLKR
jgi:hypothetical protein